MAKGEIFARYLWTVYFGITVVYFLFKKYKGGIPVILRWIVRILLIGLLIGLSIPLNHFWFLVLITKYLTISSFISFLLCRIPKTRDIVFIGGVSIFCILIWSLCSGRMMEFPIYFCVGLTARKYFKIDKLGTMSIWYCPLIFFCISFSVYYCNSWTFYNCSLSSLFADGKLWLFILRQLNGLIISVVVIRIMLQISARYNEFSRFGAFSMALYMIHTQILAIWPVLFDGSADLFCWVKLLMIVCGWTFISYSLILVLNTWAPTRKLFLGKK